MLVSIDQWHASTGIFYGHASTGIFYGHAYALICKLNKLKLNNIEFFISYSLPMILLLVLLLHGDAESNPGPKKKVLCH